ncbi:MAG: hypothetical protein ACJ763_18555 [Bdellovibrionia bacterium]
MSNTQADLQDQHLSSSSYVPGSHSQNTAPASSSQAEPVKSKSAVSSSYELNENNLEELVGRCFQGEPCELKEDPWQLYLKLKSSGRTRATDALLSYLRKELRNPKYRDQFKDDLLKMIEDFYPAQTQDFQHAAYYYYLGDFNNSLDMYLKMEKAAAEDANAFDPPKLNIANDFYELHRWKEALVYYRKALDEALSEKLRGPDQQTSIHFIQDRISEIERK